MRGGIDTYCLNHNCNGPTGGLRNEWLEKLFVTPCQCIRATGTKVGEMAEVVVSS